MLAWMLLRMRAMSEGRRARQCEDESSLGAWWFVLTGRSSLSECLFGRVLARSATSGLEFPFTSAPGPVLEWPTAERRQGMLQVASDQFRHRLPADARPIRRWAGAIGLTVAIA